MLIIFIFTSSCLTTSNFPWFLDLSGSYPNIFCSIGLTLVLLSSPNTSTTGHHFGQLLRNSGAVVILLHFSPIVYWTPSDFQETHLLMSNLLVFYKFMRFSREVFGVVCHSFLQRIMFCQNSAMACLSWLAYSIAHSFIELPKSLYHNKAVIHEGMKY